MTTKSATPSQQVNASHSQHNAPRSQVDEILEQTAIGAWIAGHKGLSLGIIVAVVLGVFAYGGYRWHSSNQLEKATTAAYAFETQTLESFQSGTMSAEDYIQNWKQFSQKWEGFDVVVPPLLKSLDKLIQDGELKTAQVLLASSPTESLGEMPTYFLNIRKSVLFEDLGDFDRAIGALEAMESSQLDLLGAKVYFDLGRLYLEQGRVEKARLSFEHVTNNMAQSEFVKMSQVYLSQIKGKNPKVQVK